MCTINIGSINHNNCKELTIHSSSVDMDSLIHSFFSGNKDKEQQEEPTVANNATVQPDPQKPLPFFVSEKLKELGLYNLEQFTAMYREAVEGDAHTLADFLHKYEKLGVFDFRGYEKNEVYEALRDYFPTMKTYKYNNFVTYF